MSERKKIAAIITEYRPRSHADVMVTKFLKGFPTDDGLLKPRVDIASMYIDQFPDADIGRSIAAEHDVPIFPSIVKALTLGSDKLAVNGVLLIGEHGDYAWNEKEQHLYPRKYFMEQICGVLAASGRAVPIYNDKHLSYNCTMQNGCMTVLVNSARRLWLVRHYLWAGEIHGWNTSLKLRSKKQSPSDFRVWTSTVFIHWKRSNVW